MPINPAIPTSAANWIREVDERVVAVFQAYAEAAAFFRKIERGTIDDLAQREMMGPSMPYWGFKIRSFPPDDQYSEQGFTHHLLTGTCQIGAVAAKQGQAEDIVMDAMALTAKFVGLEKTGDQFGVIAGEATPWAPSDGHSSINDIEVGGGSLVFFGSDQNNTKFLSIGNYEFQIHYNLYIGR